MATCARAEPCFVPFSLRQALLTSKSATMVCIARAQPWGWRDGHRANERYACHAARCCKQLDRRTLSGPCFPLLAISSHPHILLRCVSCSLAACAQSSVQTQHRVCPCTSGTSFKERRKARARVVRHVGDRAASRHRERRALHGVRRAERMTKRLLCAVHQGPSCSTQ